MTRTKDIQHSPTFYWQLFSKAVPAITIVGIIAVVNIWFLDSLITPAWGWSVIFLTLFKMFFILRLTFIQLSKIIAKSHLLAHVLALFGLLIGLIVLSFATDYAAMYLTDADSFKTNLMNGSARGIVFFEFLYFSFISFSSVGFGDIVPTTYAAKGMVMLEITLSFIVLFFGIANVNRIHVKNENNNNA
ncbi:Ion channel [Pricia antarctica]|uniref:Ion channel n=1 Tax=Pricia antarctica TaxID=641691 RepID=A0A1G6YIQ6_9FLAO|nr:potassium channel family protein [Pricia antarctica]SDD90258.1 Ion channel [Pricia antarctica]